MLRVFLSASLGVALAWAMAACSDDDKKKSSSNKLCKDNDECSEPFSECEHVVEPSTGAQIETGTCTKECVDSDECPSGYSCQEGTGFGLEPSCLQECSEKACPTGHTCIVGGDSIEVCVPTAWGISSG
jgi:hypothetical protein